MDAQALHQQLLSSTSSKNFLIAYSGGLDSHVLLHLMAAVTGSSGFKIRALYVNHGLQNESDSWAEHCKKICSDLSITFETVKLDLEINSGDSVEALARNARYQVLENALEESEVLLTAHHQDDQAETLLLQLFRGAGVDGLSSMPKISDFGADSNQKLIRPLLELERESLEVYAKNHKLNYIEDPSNQDVRFDRNFLRQTIIPQLKTRWKGFNKVLSRVANIQAETKALLDDFAAQDLEALRSVSDSSVDENRISIPALNKLSRPRQKLVLRYWIKQLGFLAPSNKKMEHFFLDFVLAQTDAEPVLHWQGVELRRFQDDIYIMSPLSDFDNQIEISWDVDQPLSIPELGIKLQPEEIKPFIEDEKGSVTVRFRQGGERIYMPKRGKHVTLKNLFHEVGIPPWERSRIPLVYLEETLVYIHGLTK